jgi:hypothetical protein
VRRSMGNKTLPQVRLITDQEPPRGINVYQAIPEMVEFRRMGAPPAGVCTLAMGRLALALDKENGELVGLQCYVKTGRWKRSEEWPALVPDAAGILVLEHTCGEEGFAYFEAELRFLWHEESSSLRITLAEGMALVFRVADCLLAGVDREGRLTDIWLLGLDLALG